MKKDIIKREDLFNTSTVLENKYYYLEDGRIITNDEQINGEFIFKYDVIMLLKVCS